jgi:O-acetyl-ADP-ribose deacetylase (regulator of RNase III)
MLKHTKGNLLDLAEAGEFDIVVQGCNCFNTMGAGIAREIRERYPMVADVDRYSERGNYNKLGNWTSGDVITNNDHTFRIINAYTQYDMSKGQDVFEYIAFELILKKLLHKYAGQRFGFPYIGMGLAGGNKQSIMEMIEWFAEENAQKGGTTTLVEFKPN